jgi:hypothetical protein
MPKIDKSGRLSSPRAARELALVILYAACLEGSDPIRLFEKRINARREPGYEFDKSSLLEYNHMSFGGPPVKTETKEEEDELVRHDEKESKIGRSLILKISFLFCFTHIWQRDSCLDGLMGISHLVTCELLFILLFLQKPKCFQLPQSWCTANLFYGLQRNSWLR